jgi:hypothetical protein
MIVHTFGDGFLHPHQFIKWPQILKMLSDNIILKNHAAIGAGNEWIANQILQQELNKDHLYLVQWTVSNRHDFVVTKALEDVINTDPVYKNNLYDNWWCSSESKTKFVLSLKEHINTDQMKLRTLNHILMIQNLFDNLNLNYRFMSSYDIDWLEGNPAEKFINWDKWIWHEKLRGMDAYSNNFKRSTKFIQPTPYIQYRWIKDILMSKLDLDWKKDKFESIELVIKQQEPKYH